jgi:CPA2 family monovalent cation:H+ antiporter-2
LEPLRDAFVALFFVSLGALIDPRLLFANLPLLGLMLLLILVAKFLVWTAVVWLFRYPMRTAIAVGTGLMQIGELSFVLVQVARSSGMVADGVFSAVVAASLISILLNVFLMRLAFRWLGRVSASRGRKVGMREGAGVSLPAEQVSGVGEEI